MSTCLFWSPWLQMRSSRSHRLAISVFSSTPTCTDSRWPRSNASCPILSTRIRFVCNKRTSLVTKCDELQPLLKHFVEATPSEGPENEISSQQRGLGTLIVCANQAEARSSEKTNKRIDATGTSYYSSKHYWTEEPKTRNRGRVREKTPGYS